MIRESNRIVSGLIKSIRYNEVHYRTSNPYNVRWQYTFKPAYYSHINVDEPTKVNKPEDTPAARPLFFNVFRDFCVRIIPGFNLYYQRFNRITDPFQIIVLPLYALLCLNLAPLSAGYYLMAALPITIFYTRMRDRCCDPPFTEPNLRDILHQNPELGPLFKQQTIHLLDFNVQYDEGLPCLKKFPQFNNPTFRFFSTTSHMLTGWYKFGDLQSGATMHVKFKTMPVSGRFRYNVGDPFYIYDLRVDLMNKGQFKELVLIDENQVLKTKRPFLMMI